MSKFQVGDPVRSHDLAERHTVTRTAGRYVTVDGRPGDVHESHFYHDADPSVPDVDGNPIRKGTLVEEVDDGRRIGRAEWIRDHHPDYPDHPARPHVGVSHDQFVEPIPFPAQSLRALTADDLHRPPAPDTRDVALRVLVPEVDPEELAESVRKHVLEHHSTIGTMRDVTVEVIEDGGTQ